MNYERIKKHFEDNRDRYICIGVGAFAGFTVCVMRRRYADVLSVSDGSTLLKRTVVKPLTFLSNRPTINANVVTVIEREGRGHPGYIVRCLETNEIFPSQKVAAVTMQIPASVLTDHLNGKFDNANGLHFERIAAIA